MSKLSERHPEEHGHWDVEDIRRLLFERDMLRQHLAEAEERARRNEENAERLEWLQDHPFALRGGSGCWSITPHLETYPSLRNAIDAARAKEKERGDE